MKGGTYMPRKVERMKFRGFYCPEELWKEMQGIAEKLNESDSEFIRAAIQLRIGSPLHRMKAVGNVSADEISTDIPKMPEVKIRPAMEEIIEAAKDITPETKLEAVLSKPQKYPKGETVQTFFKK